MQNQIKRQLIIKDGLIVWNGIKDNLFLAEIDGDTVTVNCIVDGQRDFYRVTYKDKFIVDFEVADTKDLGRELKALSQHIGFQIDVAEDRMYDPVEEEAASARALAKYMAQLELDRKAYEAEEKAYLEEIDAINAEFENYESAA